MTDDPSIPKNSAFELKTDAGTKLSLTTQAKAGLERLAATLRKHVSTDCVLLIEDNANDSDLISRAFRAVDSGIKVHVVDNGRDAINYLDGAAGFADRSQFPLPRVILLDICLPYASGLEVLEHIRTHQHLANSIVIALTGSASDPDAAEAQRLGVNAYLHKPHSTSSFVEIIQGLRASGLI